MAVYFRKKYKHGTSSANLLATSLGTIKISQNYVPPITNGRDLIINWGVSNDLLNSTPCIILNYSNSVKAAVNKLKTLRHLSENNCQDIVIPWWENIDEVPDNIERLVARKVLTGSSGVGIEVFNRTKRSVDAPLYTQYIKNRIEFRVHVAGTGDAETSYIQRRRRLTSEQLSERGIVNRDLHIRNTANGYIYSDNLDISEEAKYLIHLAAARTQYALVLHFAAIDIIWDLDQNRPYVLETNTAPGITSPKTFEFYRRYFKSVIDSANNL